MFVCIVLVCCFFTNFASDISLCLFSPRAGARERVMFAYLIRYITCKYLLFEYVSRVKLCLTSPKNNVACTLLFEPEPTPLHSGGWKKISALRLRESVVIFVFLFRKAKGERCSVVGNSGLLWTRIPCHGRNLNLSMWPSMCSAISPTITNTCNRWMESNFIRDQLHRIVECANHNCSR